MLIVKHCPVCGVDRDMQVVVNKWNYISPRGKDSAVFVRFYYCEKCHTPVHMENIFTNGNHVAPVEEMKKA